MNEYKPVFKALLEKSTQDLQLKEEMITIAFYVLKSPLILFNE